MAYGEVLKPIKKLFTSLYSGNQRTETVSPDKKDEEWFQGFEI